MISSHLTLCRLAAAGIMLVTAGSAVAQVSARSPFLPPQSAAAGTPTAGAPLEYRGYMTTGEGTLYRIYDPAKKTSAWIELNERNADFEVTAKQYNQEHNTLTIEHQGKTLTLAERVAKVVSSGNAAQIMPPPPQPVTTPNVAPAVTQTVVLNPTPGDEQKRLEAVAAEVARRRALREQATQQINQGVTPQVAVPQVQPAPAQTYQQPGTQQRNTRGPNTGNRQQR